MKSIVSILSALALSACGSTASLNTKTGEVSGLESHDVANIITNKDYVDAQVKKPQKALVSMKAHPGQQITINAAEFTVWQPSGPQDEIAKPTQAKSTFVQNTEAIGGLVQKSTPLGLGLIARDVAITTSNNNLESQRIESAERTATTQSAIEAAGKVVFPPVYTVPMGSAPVAATPAAPAVGAVEAE